MGLTGPAATGELASVASGMGYVVDATLGDLGAVIINGPPDQVQQILDATGAYVVPEEFFPLEAPVPRPSPDGPLEAVGSSTPRSGRSAPKANYNHENTSSAVAAAPAKAAGGGRRLQAASYYWGHDRLDQHPAALDRMPYYSGNGGRDANVFVFDTGVHAGHQELAGRLGLGWAPAGTGINPWVDLDGHGTHVAGTVAGATAGVSPEASVHSVKVCNTCWPSSEQCLRYRCSSYDIVEMLQLMLRHRRAGTLPMPAVVSYSISSSSERNDQIPRLMETLVDLGVTVVVAAGNDGATQCDTYPRASERVISVGSIDEPSGGEDRISEFSARGDSCADVYAPGRDILSCGIGSDTEMVALSGTSMATPHVSAIAAQYLSHLPQLTGDEVRARVMRDAAASAGVGRVVQRASLRLAELHPGCAALGSSRHAACVAAMSRWCGLQAAGLRAGLSQEVGADAFGVACWTPLWRGDVALGDLTAHHGGCDSLDRAQTGDCVAAIHRWCFHSGRGTTGLAQEVGVGVFGVACWHARTYEDVAVATLATYHGGCNSVHASQTAGCVSAIHRWCFATGRGTAGMAQEVGDGVFGVACWHSDTYQEVKLVL